MTEKERKRKERREKAKKAALTAGGIALSIGGTILKGVIVNKGQGYVGDKLDNFQQNGGFSGLKKK